MLERLANGEVQVLLDAAPTGALDVEGVGDPLEQTLLTHSHLPVGFHAGTGDELLEVGHVCPFLDMAKPPSREEGGYGYCVTGRVLRGGGVGLEDSVDLIKQIVSVVMWGGRAGLCSSEGFVCLAIHLRLLLGGRGRALDAYTCSHHT